VRLGRAGHGRRAPGDDAGYLDQHRAALEGRSLLERRVKGREVVGIVHFQHVPAEAAEPGRHVLAERQLRRALDRDPVVVVDPTQVIELQVAGQRGRFAGDAFHQVAVAALDPDVVVEQLEAGLVVAGRQPAAGDGHADAVAATLAQRAGCRLDAGGVAELGMAGGFTSPLAELAQVVDRQGGCAGHCAVFLDFLDARQVNH
jgi:hypothetical protein